MEGSEIAVPTARSLFLEHLRAVKKLIDSAPTEGDDSFNKWYRELNWYVVRWNQGGFLPLRDVKAQVKKPQYAAYSTDTRWVRAVGDLIGEWIVAVEKSEQ